MGHTAPTIAEVAAEAGIDAAGLLAEVERFNAFSAAGRDEDFGTGGRPYTRALHGDARLPNPNLGALRTPPFPQRWSASCRPGSRGPRR
ncbi:hypothetical protein ACFVZD_48240 [Streptomyces sp. NPDC058287]|uniref:hypothetical protein n=1 Tax=unclassified Streptomyces TaxID=2593676 RepID=UPI0036EDD054